MPKLRSTILIGPVTALMIFAAFAQEQRTNNGHVKRVDRFAGSVRVLGRDQPVRVWIQNWTIDERQSIPALPLPSNGIAVAQVRGGKLITIIDGKRQPRLTDEWWTVPAGGTMGIETEDDTAILQVIVTGN